MAARSPEELLGMLRRNPDEVVGTPEGAWVDFKDQPYRLSEVCERFELAKDVSAFANRAEEPSCIVIGVRTRKSADSRGEVADQIRPMPAGLVDTGQVEDVVRSWVYPRLDVRVETIARGPDGPFLYAIVIPAQKDRDRPFIVCRAPRPGTDKADPSLLAVYGRVDDDCVPYPPAQVWSWLKNGWDGRSAAPAGVGIGTGEDADDLDLSAAVEFAGLQTGEAHLILQLRAPDPFPLSGFLEGDPDSVFDAIATWRPLRETGFSWWTRARPVLVGEDALGVALRGHSALVVGRDGRTTAVMGQSLLCWPQREAGPDGKFWINPTAVVEFAYETAEFIRSRVRRYMATDPFVTFRAVLSGSGGDASLLLPRAWNPGALLPRGFSGDGVTAKDWKSEWEPALAPKGAELAFALLKTVYGKFGLGESHIPLTQKRAVDVERLRCLR